MKEQNIITGCLMDEHKTISYVEVCQKYNLSEDVLIEMIEYGLIDVQHTDLKTMEFDFNMLCKIQSACRLQQDLGLNVPGVVLAIELLEELNELRQELNILKRHVEF